MTKKAIKRITDVTPQGENANRHTQRGMAALERSIQSDGWIGAITVAADGETFDGSARVEVGGAAFADVEPIIVRSDGTRPVIHIREDIPTADDPRAVKLGLAANRVAQLNLDWEPDVLAAIAAQDIDLSGLFTETEWAAVAMPEELPEPGAGGTVENDGYDPGETDDLLAPFPWFGGKARVAGRIWQRFGVVENYVEGFCGSAAALLACPFDIPTRTVNDADGYIANFWRAVAAAPDAVATAADWPVNETDLFSRHVWLIKQRETLAQRLEADPTWYDATIAGWWVWGCCAWIGTGWCSGDGPWTIGDTGDLVNIRGGNAGQGVNRKLPHLGNAGQGVNRKLPHLGDAGQGVNRQLPHLGNAGRGVNRQLPHLGDAGRGDCVIWSEHIRDYMQRLADKLRRVRVCCGDWSRVVTPSVTTRHGLTAVLLDPPYGEGAQEYSAGGNADAGIAADVWAWALENGNDPLLRIAVCGYDDGRSLPSGWSLLRWTARKGYQATEEALQNPRRECIWFSPHCLPVERAPDA